MVTASEKSPIAWSTRTSNVVLQDHPQIQLINLTSTPSLSPAESFLEYFLHMSVLDLRKKKTRLTLIMDCSKHVNCYMLGRWGPFGD